MANTYALLDASNTAVNFIVADSKPTVKPDGHSYVAVPAGANYGFGWTWDGTTFVNPAAPTLSRLKADKLAELADLRWQKETGGMMFDGHPLATDAVSQTKIIGAVVGAQLEPEATVLWKMADGTFVTLDAAALIAVGNAMRAHVQACFDNEAILAAEIEAAGSIEALDAIDISEGWPV